MDEKSSTGKTTVAQNESRLAKQKRALLENNPPRNSQLETHRDDEPGTAVQPFPDRIESHRIERFPDAWKNSLRKLPCSGLLVLCGELSFELRGWHVAKGGMKPFLVIDLFQKLADQGTGFR